MNLWLITISARNPAAGPAATLLADYVARAARYVPCMHRVVASEAQMLAEVERAAARTRPFLVLADSSGKLLTSEEIAATLSRQMDAGTQLLVLAIGPADGWSAGALARADLVVSFGRITLPHELAAVVAAEQLYRALTIRAGHPYHGGH